MEFVESYTQLRTIKRLGYRERVRDLALDVISSLSSSLENWDKFLSKPRVQFLYIHHIFKDEEVAFDKLLKALSIHHSFISHSEAVNRVLSGQIDKPYIAISSDDGLKNNLRAAEILNEYDAKACFFICPSIVGETDKKKITSFSEHRLHFPPVEFMDWKSINELQKQGHEIGGHTMNHVNLATVNEDKQWNEIQGCYEAIKKYCGKAEHFAYPYGRFFHFTESARNKVFESGFISCISAERGCHVNDGIEPLDYRNVLLRRDHVVLAWPIKHILYFLVTNARQVGDKNHNFRYQ